MTQHAPDARRPATTWPGTRRPATTWPGTRRPATTWPGTRPWAAARPSARPAPVARPAVVVTAASLPDPATERMVVDVTVAYEGPDGATVIVDNPWGLPAIVHEVRDGDELAYRLATHRPSVEPGAVGVSVVVFEPDLVALSAQADYAAGHAVRVAGSVVAQPRLDADGGVVLGVRFANTDSTGGVEAVLSGPGFDPIYLGTVGVDADVERTVPLGEPGVEGGEVSVKMFRVVDFGDRVRPESRVFTDAVTCAFESVQHGGIQHGGIQHGGVPFERAS